jgi:type I restriction enzyme S subunit
MIPEGWKRCALNRCLEREPEYGASLRGVKHVAGHTVRYIRITDITDNGKLRQNGDIVGLAIQDAASYLLKRGDILVARTGATVGKSWFHDATFQEECAFAGYLIRLRADGSALDPGYLAQYLKSPLFWQWVFSITQTGAQPNVSAALYKLMPLLLPPLPEQRAIVEVLSTWDRAIELTSRLIDAKKKLKKGLMQQLLTGRKRLTGFEEEWELVHFGDVATIRNDKNVVTATSPGLPCVELECIESGGSGRLLMSFDANAKSVKYSFKKGDVLFGRLRAYLRKFWLAEYDGCCTTEIWPLTARNTRLHNEFLHLLVQTKEFVRAACVSYGTHMPRSDWTVMGKLKVLLPPVPEQRRIADVLDTITSEINLLERRLEALRHQKKGLMQKLLTGQVRVKVEPRHHQPTEEERSR